MRCPVNARPTPTTWRCSPTWWVRTRPRMPSDATAMRRQAATRPFVPRLAAVGGEGSAGADDQRRPNAVESARRATAPRRERMVGHTDKQAIADGVRPGRRRRFRPGTTSCSAAEPRATDPDPPRPEQADESRGSGRYFFGSWRLFPSDDSPGTVPEPGSRAPSRCDDAGRTTRPHPAAGHDRSGQGWSQGRWRGERARPRRGWPGAADRGGATVGELRPVSPRHHSVRRLGRSCSGVEGATTVWSGRDRPLTAPPTDWTSAAEPVTVAALVAAAGDGDQVAWDAWSLATAGLVWSIARSHRLGPADAADVSQTVWLRLVEHLRSLRDPEHVGGWLATTPGMSACA